MWAARDGDGNAFSSLVSEHRALVIGLCRRLLRDDHLAEDALQEACVTAWVEIGRLRNPEQFGPWLAGIAINLCKGWLRKPRPNEWSLDALSGGLFFGFSESVEPGPEDRALQVHVAEVVHEAIRELPESQQRPMFLYYIDGLAHREVAALLGTSPGAIRVRLHDARSKLKQKLLELWEEEMPSNEKEMPMRLLDVSEARPSQQSALHVAILSDEKEERYLPIFMGAAEGTALAMQLEGIETARPMTYAFAACLVKALGGTLEGVRITRLHESTFYAVAVVAGPNGRKEVDARPSDALNLALAMDVPVTVDRSVFESLETAKSHKDVNLSQQQCSGLIEKARSGEKGSAKIVGGIQAG